MKVNWSNLTILAVVLNLAALIITAVTKINYIFLATVGTELAGMLFGIGFAVAVFTNTNTNKTEED